MNEARSDDEEHGRGHTRDDGFACEDAPPHRGRVLLTAVLVPAVGAAGGAVGALFRGSTTVEGPLLVVMMAVAFLATFALFSLSSIWLINKASLLVSRMWSHRDRRDRGGR
ncbi:hypothetical protein ACF068_30340 [Streptomyces sp. NPDC016309]|uniref:hypothetical protein n=1 Tax=Streptomyces sp. NPDC016309 TaxID=3364965 RepID=UPI0036FD78C3